VLRFFQSDRNIRERTMEPDSAEKPILCPSAQPEWQGALVFGVQTGTPAVGLRVGYLTEALPVTPEILAAAAPATPLRHSHNLLEQQPPL
jgi:hypothetical protein